MRGLAIGCIYLVLAGCDGLGPHADRALRSAVMASEPTEINRREGDTWVSSRDGGQTLTVVLPGRAETVVELQVGGRDIGGPFTSDTRPRSRCRSISRRPARTGICWPHGFHAARTTTTAPRPTVVSLWSRAPTHYRGCPAVAHVHNEGR